MLPVHVVGAHIDVVIFPDDIEGGLVAIGMSFDLNA
jgi:hypothetical protein